MNRGARIRLILVVLALALCQSVGDALAQRGRPDDVRPYVQVGRKFEVRVYASPTIQGNHVIDPGQLLSKRIVTHKAGSGSFLNEDGLVLTNYHVIAPLTEVVSEFDPNNNRLTVAEPLGSGHLIFEDTDNDPNTPPVRTAVAQAIHGQERYDIALLKTVSDSRRHRGARLQDPFDIDPNAEIWAAGYPGTGGDTLTTTPGQFLGFMPWGAIKTDLRIGPGSSGGAALHDKKLFGITTAGTAPEVGGFPFGYANPIVWATASLAYANLRFGLRVPEIDKDWVENRLNKHPSHTDVYVGGYIHSEQRRQPVPGALVVFFRADKTVRQIVQLLQEYQRFEKVIAAKQLHDPNGRFGFTQEVIAGRLKIPIETVRQWIEFPESRFSGDLRRFIRGEFFFSFSPTDSAGFYFVSVPRKRQLKVRVEANGIFPKNDTYRAPDEVWTRMTDLLVYER